MIKFRLGCTSYVYPDALLPNVEKCAGVFDDIEVVLFESNDASNLPSKTDIERMAEISMKIGTTFTIHFPIDCKAAAESKEEREHFSSKVLQIVELTRPVFPFAYILHLEGITSPFTDNSKHEWQERSRTVCEELVNHQYVDSELIALENLGYPWEYNVDIVNKYEFSYCLDFGHLCRYGSDWRIPFVKLLPKTKVIHLHGWNGKKDHVSLEEHDRRDLEELASVLKRNFTGVISLELFETKAVFDSKKLWEELCR
jgi:sugar phosphate isomerase/epimerase